MLCLTPCDSNLPAAARGNHIEKAREFQKNIYFYFMGYAKAFNCVDHNTLENS